MVYQAEAVIDLEAEAQRVGSGHSGREQAADQRVADAAGKGAKPPGYAAETRSHNAVVAAVAQGRADWGVAIETAALPAGLGFLSVREECYDFVIAQSRAERPAVRAFRELLRNPQILIGLRSLRFTTVP